MNVFAVGPWSVVAFGLFLVWSLAVVREFTRGQLVRSGRSFTVRLGRFSLDVGEGEAETK